MQRVGDVKDFSRKYDGKKVRMFSCTSHGDRLFCGSDYCKTCGCELNNQILTINNTLYTTLSGKTEAIRQDDEIRFVNSEKFEKHKERLCTQESKE